MKIKTDYLSLATDMSVKAKPQLELWLQIYYEPYNNQNHITI